MIKGKKFYDFTYKAVIGIKKEGHFGLVFRYQGYFF